MCLRPRGRSGLKYNKQLEAELDYPSPSSWAEWVEILQYNRKGWKVFWSPSSWAEWVEITCIPVYELFRTVSVLVGGVG